MYDEGVTVGEKVRDTACYFPLSRRKLTVMYQQPALSSRLI